MTNLFGERAATCRLFMLGLLLTACGGGSDKDKSDAMVLPADGAIPADLGAGGASPLADGGIEAAVAPDAPVAGPMAPKLTSPDQSKAAGVIDVTGVAEPGADVIIKLLLGGQVLVQRTLVSGVDGSFSVNLTYRGVANAQTFVVDVLQVTTKGASPSTKVSLVHDTPFSITGSLAQAALASTKGTKVIVRLYRNADVAHVLDYVAEQTVNVAADQPVAASFSLPAGPGPYWVRAFRDSFGPDGGMSDGQPSFGFDAQITAPVSVTNPTFNIVNLTLAAPPNAPDHFSSFNVVYNNITPQSIPPSVRMGDKRLVGKGRCLGFFVDASVSRVGPGTKLSKPWLKLPSGNIVNLKDDGACSETVRDNSGSSFDEAEGDNRYRFGAADPDERSEGVYAFFYQHDSGHIHIQTDELKAKVKLTLLREITSPDGSAAVKTLTPAITWAAVPNAKLYEARLRALSGAWDNASRATRFVTQPTYTPETLNDNTCYELIVSALDGNPFTDDVDAVGYAHAHYFCVDLDGADTIAVSGTITNRTAQNYPMMLRFTSSDGKSSVSVRVPANATSYKAVMLADPLDDKGDARAFIDRAASGWDSSLENQGYQVSRDNLTFGANLTLPITFNPRVVAQSPQWFGDATIRPKFTWEDYAITAGVLKPAGPFVYAVWVGAEATGSPPLIYALPSTVTSLDLANPPPAAQSLDIGAFYNCVLGNGTFSTSATGSSQCTGAALKPSLDQLATSALYVWAVAVLECNFAELTHPAKSSPAEQANPFVACVQKALTDGLTFAQSAETPFFVK